MAKGGRIPCHSGSSISFQQALLVQTISIKSLTWSLENYDIIR